MPRRFGSDRSAFQNQSITLADTSGIPLIDTDNTFGASPLGNALREQTQFGLPNATFNLLPPDPALPISDYENGLPYWSLQTTDNITATAVYDSTTQTWGVKIDPGTAPSGDYLTLKTRSWVTTDDNLALRQKASLTLAKNGTYAGTSQWNLTLSAEYFDYTNTSLGTTTIGTVYDNTTWTSISGTTTTGGSAIPASAAWAEFTVKLTATQNITSSTSATLKSLLLATSTPAAGGSFVVVDTFTASGTWTRPTGVTNLLAVIGIGGGGGGAGGQVRTTDRAAIASSGQALVATGGPSGGASGLGLIENIYVGNVDSISVGIGTAGAGGAGTTFSKAATGTARVSSAGSGFGTNGGAGGSTTFGTMLTVGGGAGGTANFAGGPAAATPTATVYGIVTFAGVGGVAQGTAVGSASTTSTYSQIPYHPLPYVSGGAGGNGSGSGGSSGTAATGGAAGSAGILASSSAGGTASIGTAVSPAVGVGTVGAGGAGGGAGGGGGVARFGTGTVTILGTAGNGGTAADGTGVGGAGGGAVCVSVDTAANYNASTITITSGNGAAGGKGVLYVFYVA